MEQQPVSTSEPAAKRWTTRELLAWTTNFLKEKTVESPRTLAEMLLSSVLGCERLRLYMEVDRIASPEELSALRALVVRAGRHEPIQFLLGQWSFHGREFEVAPCTLIPRPETELLVDDALRWTREALDRGEFSSAIRCADVGTGTGCIAISYAAAVRGILKSGGGGCRPLGGPVTKSAPVEALPVIDVSAEERAAQPALVLPSQPLTLQVIASDIVADAIVLAKRNASRHGLEAAIEFRVSDLFNAYKSDEQFDIILSNPPYIADDEWEGLDANVREYEPATALRGGRDGLDVVKRLLDCAARRLRVGGLLLIEIGWKQGDSVKSLAIASNHWREVSIQRDGNGNDRFLRAIRP